MATLYNLEPQPTAKVVLQTTAGDLSLELFAKQTPLACRSFLQHCLDGYYNNTIFHRLVPGFIIQGGDPTGTGSGGISALDDGDSFQDEFHSRLKFNRRGLLGMANDGKDNNGSQFFLTLGETPELQGRHTMFGRIEGDTIYNLIKMGEAELMEGEASDRPMYPNRILGVEILVNPFEDMVARVREAPRTQLGDGKKDLKKRKKPAGRNVLSFGVDEGDGEGAMPVLKKSRVNPALAQHVADIERPVDPSLPKKQLRKKLEPLRQSSIAEVDVETTRPPKEPEVVSAPQPPQPANEAEYGEEQNEEDAPTAKDVRRRTALDHTNAEIAAIKASMRRKADHKSNDSEKPRSALEAMIPATSTRGRKRGNGSDEKGAIDLFKAFKARLEVLPEDSTTHVEEQGSKQTSKSNSQPQAEHAALDAADADVALCDLHFIANCQSCKSWDEDKPDGDANADNDDDPIWMAHTLSFAKDTLGKDLAWKKKMDEIEILDPREKIKVSKPDKRHEQKTRPKR